MARYLEKHRFYHGVDHLEDCLRHLDAHAAAAAAAAEIEIALWFHDAIYDIRASDNEERSTAWARDAISGAEWQDPGVAAALGERVADLILATQHAAVPAAADARLMVDIDLAILGSGEERFDRYERDVRREYRWVPGFLYRRKRAEVLRSFLDRPSIFLTAPFRTRYESRARSNLERSLARLRR